MPTIQQQTVEFDCTVSYLYAYVTQPWCWHEWHPSSQSAQAAVSTLRSGDTFDEVIVVQPLAPLALRLQREVHYVVEEAQADRAFQVHGTMRDGWLRIRYEFAAIPRGTRFMRILSFDVSGPTRLLLPLLRRRQETLGHVALANLKLRVEARQGVGQRS